ncbi:MAG TPA: PEP-CTERM system TPR-repeat protein PrsT, partial [Gammaproteobacteria bacterium]|nr:PEP-CTERM system TPR-repeat protein PrsT [Gammaproteobacteria bacterium]
ENLSSDSEALALYGLILKNQGDLEEATLTLSRAIQMDSAVSEAYRIYALLLATQGESGAEVEAVFAQAIKSAVPGSRDHWLAVLQRAYYFSDSNQPAAALKDVELADKIYGNLETRYAKARILLQNRQVDEARAILLEIESRYRSFRDVPLLLATIFLQDKNYSQAERLVSRYLFDHPKNVGAYRLLGEILIQSGQLERARKVVEEGLLLSVDHLGLTLLSAQLYLREGETERGLQLMEEIVDKNPNEDILRFKLAGALVDADQVDRGLTELDTLLGRPQAGPQIHLTKTLALLDAQRFDAAIKAANQWVAAYPKEPVAYNLMGIAHLSLKQEDEAMASFERAHQLDGKNPSPAFNIGEIAMGRGDYELAEKWFLDVWKQDENNVVAIEKMAKLARARKDFDAYERWLRLALRSDANSIKNRIALIKYLFSEERLNEVLAQINEGLEVEPDQPDLTLFHCELLIRRGKPEQAVQSCRRVLNAYPNHIDANLLISQAYMAAGYPEEAKFHLRQVLQEQEQNQSATGILALLLLQEKQFSRAEPLVNRYRQLWPEAVMGLELEADLAHGVQDFSRAERALRQAIEIEASERNAIALAQVIKLGRGWQQVERFVDAWIADRPQDTGLMIWMANEYLALAQIELAITYWQKVIAVKPNNLVALNNLAWHLRDKEYQQALSHAEKAYQLAPEVPAVMDTYAMLLVEENKWTKAQELLSRAYQKQRNNADIAYHLALVNSHLNAKERAREILEPFIYSQREFNSRAEAEALWQELKQ